MTEKGYGKDWNCLNLSSIWTKLIKESAECDHYSSDFLIHYDCIVRKLNAGWNKLTEYFGFRDYGVDHDAFIKCRFPEYNYRKIYKLTIEHGEYLNYEGYCDWKAELSDISEEPVENILKMIEEDE